MTENSTSKQNRKLAAILFADIAGYTAMMQSDEGKTMNKLRHYQTVLKNQVTQCIIPLKMVVAFQHLEDMQPTSLVIGMNKLEIGRMR